MKVAIISTHSFPIGLRGPITKTGDVVIMDLVRSLSELGHEVSFFTPANGFVPNNVTVYPMLCSFGKYPPSSEHCEQDAFNKYRDILLAQDIIHDFSVTKIISENLYKIGYKNIISTLMGGAWNYEYQPHNLVVWSNAHRDRVLRGATDYENTPTPDLAGPPGKPVKDAKIVYGGIDTLFYTPSYDKKDFFLWMNRWHPAKGYKIAIELAKQTGIKLVMAGENPKNELFEYQRDCALEAMVLANGYPNIHFEWLPPDLDHHVAKRELYRQAKALLYTVQFQEPFGLSQVEALSCGTPVIGTNFGSVPEIIKNDINGYVCDNMIQSLYMAIKNVGKIDYQTCRANAIIRFDKFVMAKSYLDEYENVLAGRIL